jgi:ribokinase
MKENQLDILAIGDIAINAFIRIKEAGVHCELNKEKCQIVLNFKDKVPYEFVEIVKAVGNAPNATVAGARLGLKMGLVSNIGDDRNGKDCLEVLAKEKIGAENITVNENMATNYHYVLWYEDDRTILVKHEPYKYSLQKFEPPKWIYLSSLAENSENYIKEIEKFLSENPETKLAFQPGTFQIKMSKEKLENIYKRADVCLCNVEEAKKILGKDLEIPDLLSEIRMLGVKIPVITDGRHGAYMYEENDMWFMPLYPDSHPPYERTGAGDAFSGTFISALTLGKKPIEALTWGPINSMSVVQKIGAQAGLLSRPELEKYLKEAPSDYAPRKM